MRYTNFIVRRDYETGEYKFLGKYFESLEEATQAREECEDYLDRKYDEERDRRMEEKYYEES